MTFEDYLISKKIDREAFLQAEPALFESWRSEFVQLHPSSFTGQKLYLINPIRRKYILKEVEKNKVNEAKPVPADAPPQDLTVATQSLTGTTESALEGKPTVSPVKSARPVFRPKPKTS